MPEQGRLEGALKREQSLTSDWVALQALIDGVRVKEIQNVPKVNGFLTEIFRSDWELDDGPVNQVFQVGLDPGQISAWHAHQFTTDRLFASYGQVHVVLYDARLKSPTYRLVNEFLIGPIRPALIVVPPGVWHGLQSGFDERSLVINLVDRAYTYEDPDHWYLPSDTWEIPYSFTTPS